MTDVDLRNVADSLISKIASPGASGREFELFGDALDNAAWVDFSETRVVLDPFVNATADEAGEPELSLVEIESLEALLDLEVEARDYQWFHHQFKSSVFNAVWRRVLVTIDYQHGTYGTTTITPDTEAGVIHYHYERPNDPEGLFTEDATWNVALITDLLMLRLPASYEADFADIYFTIDNISSADEYFSKEAFFSRVELYWYVKLSTYPYYNAIQNFNNAIVYPVYEEHIQNSWTELRQVLTDEFGEGEEDISEALEQYRFIPPPVPAEHDFDVVEPGLFNLGLRFIYRQEWRHLGNQRGEVVRTIPLGPKQTEKVSTKIVRRQKVTRTSENLKSSETTTETTDSTKDSSEVVDEATRSMNWSFNQDVEGGFNAGIWKIGGSTRFGIGGESSQSSKETSTRLSETMQKVASKIRTETKVSVSTASETEFEETAAREIQNPNDEIALTYVYSKLQQQYEVLTRLAEVQNVVMVSEPVPSPREIGFQWVKQHDWIIAKVLLDDSFREALSSISQDVASPSLTEAESDLRAARDTTLEHLGKFAESAGTATDIDIVEESQRGYRETLRERIERQKADFLVRHKRFRLYEHIYKNILHYMRAIWQHEDPQQRLLRYRKAGIKVPLEWQFELESGGSMSLSDVIGMLATGSANIPGHFVAYAGGQEVDLADLINPAGPIGFHGNYAVYYMRPEYASADLFSMLHLFKSPYLFPDEDSGTEELLDPLQIQFAEQFPVNTISDATIDAVIDEMIDFVPELRLEFERARRRDERNESDSFVQDFLNDKLLFKKHYAEYRFRKEQCRRFVVDTNSLVIDLLPGEGSALEDFKLAHRAFDARMAYFDSEKARLELKRRSALIRAKEYGDPEISRERVVIVEESSEHIGQIVSGSIAGQPIDGND